MTMVRITEIKALAHYKLWFRFGDGATGEVDLSDLAGQGVSRREISRFYGIVINGTRPRMGRVASGGTGCFVG